jgi:hypothetical protein
VSTTGWVDPADFEGALRDLSKRMVRLERRPASMSTTDLLGPGLASYAVGILDWNATEATLNGFYYTYPGSLGSPDPLLSWTGQTIAKDDGTGMQQVWNTDGAVPIYWVRTYAPNVVPGGPPVFDDWKRFATGSGLIEGDMLDPDTFPGEVVPVDPPTDSPTPVTTKGPSAVIVNYEWTRGESVDLYVSLVDGGPIDATTLHTSLMVASSTPTRQATRCPSTPTCSSPWSPRTPLARRSSRHGCRARPEASSRSTCTCSSAPSSPRS